MELLFVVLAGIAIGAAARYTFRRRDNHGVVLMPALGGSVAALIWAGLTWLGLPFDGGWIWLYMFAGTAIIVGVADPTLGVVRKRADEARLVTLRKA